MRFTDDGQVESWQGMPILLDNSFEKVSDSDDRKIHHSVLKFVRILKFLPPYFLARRNWTRRDLK